jgi:phosphotransferase system enzyme I (PtsI)
MKIDKVLGFATDVGGKTSHTAIVPDPSKFRLSSAGNHFPSVRTNDDIIIDGSAGLVIAHPDPEVRKRYEDKKSLYEKAQDDLLDYAKLPAVTRDGYAVEIGGNIEFVEEIPSAIATGRTGSASIARSSSTSIVRSFR